MDKLHDECGIIGIVNHPKAGYLTYLGLYALQHRGQESCGIVCADKSRFILERGMGLVYDVFTDSRLNNLKGTTAIGHTRYSTTGESTETNIQPLVVKSIFGQLALAHNGNLINLNSLKKKLEEKGAIFHTTSDSEVVLHLIAHSKETKMVDRISDSVQQLKGAYSLLFMHDDMIVGIRDPHGIRPLVIGKLNDSYLLSSETCALDLLDAEFVRDVEPGEMVVITKEGIESFFPHKQKATAFCIFEYIYFARPDSIIFGNSTYRIRKTLGEYLFREKSVDADIVIPVPDSGIPAAVGYSQASGIPFEKGLIRNHYVGRTFIQPTQKNRDFAVKLKLNPVKDILNGKRVIVIDDSVVRGTTSRKIIKMIRNAGAKEVHMRISSPPVMFPCYYGIDTPSMQELIANNYSVEGIKNYIMADSLGYLSAEGMLKSIQETTLDPNGEKRTFCTACFSGNYPTEIADTSP